MKASKVSVAYSVAIVTTDGTKYNVTKALLDLSLAENPGELAQKASIKVANIKVNGKLMTALIKLKDKVFIYADDGSGAKEVFRGNIWTKGYSSATEKEITYTAFDHLKYLHESKDNRFYKSGKSTKAIVTDICNAWGISVDCSYAGITHPMLTYRAKCISDMILETLEAAKKENGKKYAVRSIHDVIKISERGTNSTIYQFKSKQNVISTSSNQTMEGMVTKVIIIGSEEKNDRAVVEGVVVGDTGKYGTLQDIITRDTNTTRAAAKTEAEQLIKEKGKPFFDFSFQAIDIPWIHHGDKIEVAAGDMVGTFYVVSVDHDIKSKTMKVEVEL